MSFVWIIQLFVLAEVCCSFDTQQNDTASRIGCWTSFTANYTYDQQMDNRSCFLCWNIGYQLCFDDNETIIEYNCSSILHICHERRRQEESFEIDKLLKVSKDQMRERKSFVVKCLENQVINIRLVLFVQMSSNRCCVNNDSLTECNCFTDYQSNVEQQCKERHKCEVIMPDKALDELPVINCSKLPALRYLEMIYECQNTSSSSEFQTTTTAEAVHRSKSIHENTAPGKSEIHMIQTQHNTEVEGNMTVTPRNQVVIAGQRMEMECGVEGNNIRIFRWDVTKPGKATENIVPINGASYRLGNSTHLGVDVNNSGSGIIYYNATEFEDAGIYTCNTIAGGGEKTAHSAHLIVLESLPNCASNYSDETNSSEDTGAEYPANLNSFTMQCSVSFRGFWAPTMQWIHYDSSGFVTRQDQLEKDGIKTEFITNSSVMSYLTISRDMLHKAGYFSCRTYFERTTDGSLIMDATNIPDFVFVWNSSFYSSPSSSSNTMKQPERHYKHVHGVLWWITVCVLLVLLVIIVTVSTLCYIKNRQSDRRRRREQQEEQKRNATSPESPCENETGQEKHTYAEINESQINPVDNPPKTRPRVKTTTVSTTTLHSTGYSRSILHKIFDSKSQPVLFLS